jgi:hypothetical protein
MTSFTLDTNCIYALAKGEPDAVFVRSLAEAHRTGTALVAISASENHPGGGTLTSFAQFQANIARLGLGHLEELKPLGCWDVTFWDWCLWANDAMTALERQIHATLFPHIEYELADYCRRLGSKPDRPLPRGWRNAKCDVLALWSHIHHGREVFVTGDENFHAPTKKPALLALGPGEICRPMEAVALI